MMRPGLRALPAEQTAFSAVASVSMVFQYAAIPLVITMRCVVPRGESLAAIAMMVSLEMDSLAQVTLSVKYKSNLNLSKCEPTFVLRYNLR